MDFQFLGKEFYSKKSLLSFLFDIYLNELDIFISNYQKHTLKYKDVFFFNQEEANQAFKRMIYKFSSPRVSTVLNKYGSTRGIKDAYKVHRAVHYKEYARFFGKKSEPFCLQYVRYGATFLLGIVGSKKHIEELRSALNFFLKLICI